MSIGTVFISYSHKDKQWLERLKVHLKPFVDDISIDVWDDTRIRVGDDWQGEIESALNKAKVAVLLISADFLASEFIKNNEIPNILAGMDANRVRMSL